MVTMYVVEVVYVCVEVVEGDVSVISLSVQQLGRNFFEILSNFVVHMKWLSDWKSVITR